MEDDKKPVVLRTPLPRGRTFAFAACALCGAYVCSHVALTIIAPDDTQRDATTLIASTTASGDTGFSVVSFDAITEAEYRVDMPKVYGVVTKPTKPST
jgi:hypothetical protein